MITFILSLAALVFLNIAGTGPIFGAIMGAKFGPAAYLWIVFGCIFAGAVHDYLGGMLSMRHDGAGLPEIIGHYLGTATKNVMLVVHDVGHHHLLLLLHRHDAAHRQDHRQGLSAVRPVAAVHGRGADGVALPPLAHAARTVDALLQHGGRDGARPLDRQHLPRAVHHRRLRCHLWLPRHAEPADGPLRRERTHGAPAVLRRDDYRGGRGADMGHGVDMVFLWRAHARL